MKYITNTTNSLKRVNKDKPSRISYDMGCNYDTIYIYIYIYIYTHTYTYIHTYIHIYEGPGAAQAAHGGRQRQAADGMGAPEPNPIYKFSKLVFLIYLSYDLALFEAGYLGLSSWGLGAPNASVRPRRA